MKNFWKPPFQLNEKARKMILTMKLTVFILFLTLMQVSATVYSQATKFTFRAENKQVVEVLRQIEESSDFRFFFLREQVDVERKVTVIAREATVEQILDELFRGQPVRYEFANESLIVLTRSDNPLGSVSGYLEANMQQPAVSGKVTDSAGQPLPGATVVVKGTMQGTVTNADGYYSLTNIPEDATLVFSFVGMKTQEVVVGDQTVINVTMEEETIGLGEVIAIGYGTQSKRDLTGSVSSVNANDFKDAQMINAVQALQGRASGVSVIQQTGQPGAPFMVQIRGVGTLGNTTPLYVIDGVVGAGGGNSINPNDIESIDILKDASASAIYGSRAANGVVLITTKRGKSGKPAINFDSYVGAQSVWKKLDVLNAQQYAEYSNEMQTNGGQPLIPALQNPSALKDVTDWQDVIFRNGIIQDHNVSVSGGNDNGRYLFSAGYFDQEGILKSTGFNRYSFRANSDFNIGRKLKFGESLLISHTKTYGVDEGSSQSLVNAIHMPTYITVYDETELGGYNGTDVADGCDPKNPLRILELTDRTLKYLALIGNAFLKYEILEGLEYKFSVSMDYTTGSTYNYTPKYTAGERDINQYSTLSESQSNNNTMSIENTLDYKKIIGKHKFSVLAGYTRQWYDGRNFGANVRDFPNNDIRVIGGAASIQSVSGSANDWSLASILGRVTYNYNDKYLLTSNIRRDGSSRFAPGNKYGIFPSFSVGWRLSEESFLKNSEIISDLKVKYGWGQLGMQEIGLYPYQATLTSGFKYVLGTAQAAVPAISQLHLSNSEISWETTTQSNVGIDLGLKNNSILFNLEYYMRKTDDMLIQVPVSISAGLKANPTLNSGSVENNGIDFMLNYRKELNDFKFDISANVGYLISNEVTSLGLRTQPLFGEQSYQRSVVGESIGHFYGYRVDRIYQTQEEVDADNALAVSKGWSLYQSGKTSPGDIRFKDLNGDGHITADDREIIGNPIPKWNYGLSLNASYRNFDFSMMLQGMAGYEVVNRNRLLMWESMTRSFNTITTVLDRWTPTNPSTTMPRAVAGDPNNNRRFSDRWMENGAYARLKSVTLGYQVPNSTLSKISNNTISNLRIYVAGNNLLTFTKFSAWDPEFTSRNSSFNNMYRGVAESIYPQARSFMFGINVGF